MACYGAQRGGHDTLRSGGIKCSAVEQATSIPDYGSLRNQTTQTAVASETLWDVGRQDGEAPIVPSLERDLTLSLQLKRATEQTLRFKPLGPKTNAKGRPVCAAEPSFLFYDNKIQCCRHTSSTPCYFLFGTLHQSGAFVASEANINHTLIYRRRRRSEGLCIVRFDSDTVVNTIWWRLASDGCYTHNDAICSMSQVIADIYLWNVLPVLSDWETSTKSSSRIASARFSSFHFFTLHSTLDVDFAA
ncbi:uncharacterized protein V6R79_025485 [Siganus canaliculatus]